MERKLTASVKTADGNPSAKITVQKLYDEFIAAKKYEVRESTLEKHEINYRLHISPKMATIRLSKLTIPKLQEWKVYMEQKGLALKTKTNAYGTFRAMLNYALKISNSLTALLRRKALFTKPPICNVCIADVDNLNYMDNGRL